MTQRNILSEPVQGFDALKAEPEGNLTLRQVMRVDLRGEQGDVLAQVVGAACVFVREGEGFEAAGLDVDWIVEVHKIKLRDTTNSQSG